MANETLGDIVEKGTIIADEVKEKGADVYQNVKDKASDAMNKVKKEAEEVDLDFNMDDVFSEVEESEVDRKEEDQ
jgi:gas vesicle protein